MAGLRDRDVEEVGRWVGGLRNSFRSCDEKYKKGAATRGILKGILNVEIKITFHILPFIVSVQSILLSLSVSDSFNHTLVG